VVIFQQMLGFLLMMAIGLAARRANVLAPEVLPKASALVANVTFPCMIVASFTGATERLGLAEAGTAFVTFAVVVAVVVAIGWGLPVLLRYPPHLRPAANLCLWLSNIGYMGMALLGAAYGERARVYVLLYLLPSNLMLYTYAIWLLRRGASLEGRAPADGGPALRGLLNPGVITTVVGGILYFAGFSMPGVLLEPLEALGGITVPLAMMVVGAQLADVPPSAVLVNRRLLAFCLLKMLVIPVAVLFAFGPFVADRDLLACCMAVLAMPTGVLVSALALIHQPSAAQETTGIVALTTVMSVVTVPVVCAAIGL